MILLASRRGFPAGAILASTLVVTAGACRPAPEPPSPLASARFAATATAAAVAGDLEPQALVERLASAGVDIVFDSELPVEYMPGTALIYAIDHEAERLEIYRYADEAQAEAAAAGVSRDGMTVADPRAPGNRMQVSWRGDPHFHRLGRLLAIYVGDDPRALDVLRATLGAPFAGAD